MQPGKVLTDNHGRTINYLRLAVTDKCNLRCFYCMPENGINWLERDELMSLGELLRISRILVGMGIEKVRITGGEPFARKDIMQLLHELSRLPGLNKIAITTNGVLTAPLVPELKKIGINSVNLSLDTLDRDRFFAISRRDELPSVLNTLDTLLQHQLDVRLNAVVMEGKNTQDILPMVALTKDLHISVRFIEEMPFNGSSHLYSGLTWDYVRIIDHIREQYPDLQKIPDKPNSTSYNYQVPGFMGRVGVIAAYSRTFCGTCNRLRITPEGMVKTCLYDHGVLNIRDLMRRQSSDEVLAAELSNIVGKRAINGWEAEKNRSSSDPVQESMATIGG